MIRLLLISGYVVRAAVQALLLLAFARAGGAAAAGEFALAFAVSTPVVITAELALRNVYQTLHNPPAFRLFFLIRAGLVTTAILILAIVAATGWLEVRPSVLLPLLMLKYVDSLLDICFGKLQSLGLVRATGRLLWLNAALSLVAIGVPVGLGLQPEWAVVGSAAGSLAVLAIVAPRLLTDQTERWAPLPGDLSRILRAGLTLGTAQTLMALVSFLPAYYLATAAGKAELGVFAAAQYAVTLAGLIFAAAMQSWLADARKELATHGSEALRRHTRLVGQYLVGAGLVGGGITVAALPILLPAVFGGQFEIDRFTAIPFALAVVLVSCESALTLPLLVLNRYASRVATAVAGLVAATIFGLATISQASVLFAGWLMVIGLTTRATTSFVAYQRTHDLPS